MNYEYNGIFDLEDIVLEQECDMLNTLMDLIHKNELFIESGYINNEAYDDFVNKMYQMYMEATDRNKQQKAISQYMRDNNLGDVDGKNPSKVKQARKLQNTLLQHDFNPTDGTIRSDYTNPDGSAKRVPFRMYNTKTVDQSSDPNVNGKTIDGDAAYYANRDNPNSQQYINVPSNRFKQSPQASSQLTLHHELGHHNAHNTYMQSHPNQYGDATENLPQSDPANVMVQKVNSPEYPYVNNHDQKSTELYADLHGAKNARVRTKHWGNKSSGKNYKQKLNYGTRNVTDDEILRYFKTMSDSIRYTKDEINKIFQEFDVFLNQINNVKAKGTISPSDTEVIGFLKGVFNTNAEFNYNNANGGNGISNIDRDFLLKIDNIRQLAATRTNIIKWITKIERMPKEKLEGAMVTTGPNNEQTPIFDYIKQVKEQAIALGKEIENLRKDLDNMRNNGVSQEARKAYSFSTKEIQISNPRIGYNNTMLHEWHNYAMKFNLYDKGLANIEGIKQKYINIAKSLDWVLDSSTKMRYDFVMQNKDRIQEYFTNFFNEYYSLDRLFK